jgi:phenylpropionate dioxygenase-like ring-hydroxylating dioxygenase large terminal subunit
MPLKGDRVLSHQDNEAITHVGPGTVMGNLLREYWIPALLSSELPTPDCDPVRVMLLGERLVAFRDSAGEVGLLPHSCPHRGASLFFGRNEQGGLRCVYHGWKFGVDGRCLDMPNEPPESNFKDKVRARSYPCVERAGAVWAYLGPRLQTPPLPHFEVFDALAADTVTQAYSVQCNWLQAMEGDHDPTHFVFLHAGHARAEDAPEGSNLRVQLSDRRPGYKVLDTAAGMMSGTHRPIPGTDDLSWHLRNFLLPCHTITGVGISPDISVAGLTAKRAGLLSRVPMDDGHTMTFQFSVGLDASLQASAPQNAGIPVSEYTGLPLLPNTTDWYGRFRWKPGEHNDYLIDREQQRRGESYTGIDGVIIEDVMVTESMGPIYDRTNEHLGVSDTTTIRMRRCLLAAARALAEQGTPAPGVDDPDAFLIRSGIVTLPKDADWLEAAERLRRGWDLLPELEQRDWSPQPAPAAG